MAWRFGLVFSAMLWVGGAGCSGATDTGLPDAGPTPDAGPIGPADAGRDGGRLDIGPADPDGGPGDPDSGDLDAGNIDGGELDGGLSDPDAGPVADGGPADTGPPAPDTGPPDAGDLPPTCAITAPPDGTTQDFDDDFTFVAAASDPEDGALSGPSVVWRSDRVVAPLGSGLSTTTLLDPGSHVITCTATDSAGNVGTDSITVTSRSPVAAIFHPGDGETRAASSSIPFVGQGRDFEDGMRTGASLVWTSSLDGMIGTGTMFNRMLSPGTNVITLTVTDSDGNTGVDTITLTITP